MIRTRTTLRLRIWRRKQRQYLTRLPHNQESPARDASNRNSKVRRQPQKFWIQNLLNKPKVTTICLQHSFRISRCSRCRRRPTGHQEIKKAKCFQEAVIAQRPTKNSNRASSSSSVQSSRWWSFRWRSKNGWLVISRQERTVWTGFSQKAT